MKDEMVILTRTFDLLAWLLPKAEQFPRDTGKPWYSA